MSEFDKRYDEYDDSNKESERELIRKQTEEFLSKGGEITEVPNGVTSTDGKSLDTTLNPNASKSQRQKRCLENEN